MDLHQWMLADLAAVRSKLFDSIAALIPTERWLEAVDGGGSTVTHLLLHIARHQDLAVNSVARQQDALYLARRESLGTSQAPVGAGLAEKEDPAITALVRPDALIDFVRAVFDGTDEWLRRLGSPALDAVPDAAGGLTEHALLTQAEFGWLYGMWNDKAIWWFAQWPVIGHGNAHVGEGISVRNRMGLSPF